jgi:hypothetical protein
MGLQFFTKRVEILIWGCSRTKRLGTAYEGHFGAVVGEIQ